MIISALLLTPAALATPPAILEQVSQPQAYDWQFQTLKTDGTQKADNAKTMSGSLRGTQSFLGGALVIDDWNND